jgi:SpoVK/Ycf46/Vps4 family AAA+-type ATPase
VNFSEVEREVSRFELLKTLILETCHDKNAIRAFLLADLKFVLLRLGFSERTIEADSAVISMLFLSLVLEGGQTWELAQNISSWEKLGAAQKNGMGKIAEECVMGILKLPPYHDRFVLISGIQQCGEEVSSLTLKELSSVFYKFAELVIYFDPNVSFGEKIDLLKNIDILIQRDYQIHDNKLVDQVSSNKQNDKSAFQEFDRLIGMKNVKDEVANLENFLKIQKIRMERGLLKVPVSLHAVFCGPPGTGKTSIARLLGSLYRELGFLEKGHVIEIDRSGLVAGYIGQTSLKVEAIINSALDGVLFIDEAYTLKPENSPNDFGQEAIDILLKRMEDCRDRLVVIVAGYSDEMQRFIESNPGLKSRFNRFFYFDHYAPEELAQIFEKFSTDSGFNLTIDAKEKLFMLLNELYADRDKTFGNGRLVRNIFEKSIERQSNRLVNESQLTDEALNTIIATDIYTGC